MKQRWVWSALLALALVVIAFNPGMWSNMAFAQGPKPTPPKPKAPSANVGTAFTYQGQLKNNGVLVNNLCASYFVLYADGGGITPIVGVYGSPNPVGVTNGLFTVQLDFGSSAFQGDARWLKLWVKCSGDSDWTTLSLQPVTPAPYVLYSMKTAWGQSLAGSGVGLAAQSSDWIGLAGVATQSPFLNPFSLGMSGVYGRGDDVGVWGESSTTNGLGVEGLNPTSNNYGQLGTPSNGVRGVGVSAGGNGVYGDSATGDGVSGHASDPNRSGVYGFNDGGGYGVYGYCTGSGCYGVFSNGDMKVTGNLKVDGPATGFFPRPAYDSGWRALNPGQCVTLNHNLGGNVDNYVVDLLLRIQTEGISSFGYGSYQYNGGWRGADYDNLTNASVQICLSPNEYLAYDGRIRIWVYK